MSPLSQQESPILCNLKCHEQNLNTSTLGSGLSQLHISFLLVAQESAFCFHDSLSLMHLYASTEQKYNIPVQRWILHEGEGTGEHCTKFGFLYKIS